MSERVLLAMTCKQVGPREIETTLSSDRTDRMKDRIMQNWRLDEYRRNPVIFWNHETRDLPIARSTWIGVVNGQLRSRDEFPPLGLYPFADQVHDLVVAGFINTKSVGFIPIKKVYDEQRGGWDFLESTLLEHSYVGLPANVDAVIDGRAAPDVAAVRKWLGRSSAPAGGGVVLDLDADDVGDLDPRAVVEALRVIIPQLAAQELDRLRGRIDDAVDLDAIDGAFDPLANSTDRALLVDAVKSVIPPMVVAAVNRLRGRVD